MKLTTRLYKIFSQKKKLQKALFQELAYWNFEKKKCMDIRFTTDMVQLEFFADQCAGDLEMYDKNINKLTKELQNI